MALINVYSRSPISHLFTIVSDDGTKISQVIEGMNKHVIYGPNIHGTNDLRQTVPRITQMEEDLFNKIKKYYTNMGHTKLFGGKDIHGVKQEPLIYTAKDENEAMSRMLDFQPVITEKEMAMKTKDINKVDNKVA